MLEVWNLAMLLWMGASTGSWLDFRSQPIADVLSVLLRTHGKGDGSGSISSWKSMLIADARYSLQLRVRALFLSTEKR